LNMSPFKFIMVVFFLTAPFVAKCQDTTFQVYNPNADAMLDLNEAVTRANALNKHVLVQIGGNWCKWCRMFYKWSHENATIDSIIKADYVVLHSNFSKENKNPALMQRLDYPQRFGFPVFVILDGSGNRIHTQNTGYLEEGEGYSEKKVAEFLKQWNAAALRPEQYK
jgi:thiol:disulfide interchange protein